MVLPFEPPLPGPRSRAPRPGIHPGFMVFLVLASLAIGGGTAWLLLSRLHSMSHVQEVSLPPPAPSVALALPRPPHARKAEIGKEATLQRIATEYFGAWNATVRDLIAAANPHLDIDRLSPGTVVQIPVLRKGDLVVQGSDGLFYIYFASFEDRAEAQREQEALLKTTGHAVLYHPPGRGIWRLYIGPFDQREEALQALGLLWFKYLPLLGD